MNLFDGLINIEYNCLKLYHVFGGRFVMKETKQSLAELWQLLRIKEQEYGLDDLSLTERDIFQAIINTQGKESQISLESAKKNCTHPRATFFRSLKKLREKKLLNITKDIKDNRKSYISVDSRFLN